VGTTVATQAPASSASLVVPAIIWTHADAVLLAEEQAASKAAGPLRDALTAVRNLFTLRWRRHFGSITGRGGQQPGPPFQAYMRDLANAIGHVTPGPVADRLAAVVGDAHVLGQRQARTELGLPVGEPMAPRLSVATQQDIGRAVDEAKAKVRKAEALTRTYRRGDFSTVRGVLAVAEQAGNVLDGTARTLVNEAVRDGAVAVATAVGARLLWIAERSACVHCLALSGHLSDEDGLFDASLTFAAKPMAWVPPGGLAGPPRHKNCRCRVTPWFDTEQALRDAIPRQRGSALTEPTMPEALRREAERSVLNGWALPSEPTSVRAKAAQLLLDRITDGLAPSGWQVPKRVRSDAAKDLASGTFHKRRFPA
jgi:hypothetical protein